VPDLSNGSRDQPTRGSSAALLTLGGLAAAFGAASCCSLPLVLATLGLGTAWLGGFAQLAAPHRLFLLIAATVCLAGAAVLLWRQRAAICTAGAVCTRPAIRRVTIAGLLVGLALLYLGYTYA
jgi:mercuric ion transport protein